MTRASSMTGPVEQGSVEALQPGTLLGRYEIKRFLGQGGMGQVYEAEHRDLKKRVAIKTLLPGLAASSDSRQRFLREGEAASRIRHPHVVDVTDVGAEGSVIYLVMEYLEGENLGRLIERQGFLSPAQTVEIMLPVVTAIATAHQLGVIHRDLKPDNIFLARTPYGGIQPKVLDFGISKVLGGSRTRELTGTAATVGTINYLPPETLNAAREADARSDQYGLGTILYECVTGERAFEGENFYLVLKQIAEGRFSPPSVLRPELPPRMEKVITRAMSLDPSARFESVGHLGAALLDLASESVRGLWAPFLGGAGTSVATAAPTMVAQVGSSSDRLVDRNGSGEGRLARTLATPSSGAGGTIELPPPARSSSTTIQGAIDEREEKATTPSTQRRRTVFLIGGVAVAAGLALLISSGLIGRPADPSAATADPVQQTLPPTPYPTSPPQPPVPPKPHPVLSEPQGPQSTPGPNETATAGTENIVPKSITKSRSRARKKTRATRRDPTSLEPTTPSQSGTGVVIID